MAIVSNDYFRLLFDYTHWGRDRILNAAANLSEADFTRPCGLDYPSIRATLTHQIFSEILLRGRWAGVIEPVMLDETQVPSVDALRERWILEEAALREFIAGLSDGDLERSFEYTTRAGVRISQPLWQSMYQLVNHATQHRSEVALALTQMGHSPGFLDFIAYVRERDSV